MGEDVLYLCVDPDGTEKASEQTPRRLYDAMVRNVPEKYVETHPVEKYGANEWIDTCSDTDYGYYGYNYSFDGVMLPKGTIKELTGKDMTWEDEPFRYIVLNPEQKQEKEIERLRNLTFDSLEEKCRYYQKLADYKLVSNNYILAHIDGRSFSRMVKKRFKRPFDEDFIGMMNETAKYLCENVSGVRMAYVQSDEITLVMSDFNEVSNDAEHFFGGRLCKMQSIIASLATSKFSRLYELYMLKNADSKDYPSIIENCPLFQFDCKCWNVFSSNDAYAWVLYRQIDCVRNSKEQAAQAKFSHKELFGKDTDEQIAMLKEQHGIDWNEYPDGQKFGRFVIKREIRIRRINEDGSIIDFNRNKWCIEDAYQLTEEGNKDKLLEDVPVFKINISE